MKVKIVSWHAVAAWRWDMPEDEVCGICRVQFDGTCPKCKFPGDDCPISMFSFLLIHKTRNMLTKSSHGSMQPLLSYGKYTCTIPAHKYAHDIITALSRYLDQSGIKSGQMSNVSSRYVAALISKVIRKHHSYTMRSLHDQGHRAEPSTSRTPNSSLTVP